jgi:rfaE bifunctional protein nucleotidyltransferase chain/domain
MLVTLDEMIKIRKKLKENSKSVVFTNGCFDLIHAGHIDYLLKSKSLGDILIVGLNTDISIKKIKGETRPIISQDQRAFVLSNIKPVDYVCFFDEETPERIISELIPDILVKGSDWPIDKIVGRQIVESNGGKVVTIDFVNNQSTSNIIKIILERHK